MQKRLSQLEDDLGVLQSRVRSTKTLVEGLLCEEEIPDPFELPLANCQPPWNGSFLVFQSFLQKASDLLLKFKRSFEMEENLHQLTLFSESKSLACDTAKAGNSFWSLLTRQLNYLLNAVRVKSTKFRREFEDLSLSKETARSRILTLAEKMNQIIKKGITFESVSIERSSKREAIRFPNISKIEQKVIKLLLFRDYVTKIMHLQTRLKFTLSNNNSYLQIGNNTYAPLEKLLDSCLKFPALNSGAFSSLEEGMTHLSDSLSNQQCNHSVKCIIETNTRKLNGLLVSFDDILTDLQAIRSKSIIEKEEIPDWAFAVMSKSLPERIDGYHTYEAHSCISDVQAKLYSVLSIVLQKRKFLLRVGLGPQYGDAQLFACFAELKQKNLNHHELEIEKQELELKNLDREFQQRLQDQRNRYLNLKRDLLAKLTRLQQREIKMQSSAKRKREGWNISQDRKGKRVKARMRANQDR
mmetsp:Transcript_7376/g.8069  ORF Transcript_7376/g.8069 Transcript_7376/m.8069 type:complete len:469 (+) Transcript_7376:1187-2593(+)